MANGNLCICPSGSVITQSPGSTKNTREVDAQPVNPAIKANIEINEPTFPITFHSIVRDPLMRALYINFFQLFLLKSIHIV